MHFEPYPFEKLSILLKDVAPPKHLQPLFLTIGEPQFETPEFIIKELQDRAYELRYYPKTIGEESLKEALISFVKRAHNINLAHSQIIPTLGTREVLFSFPQWYLHDKPSPIMAYPNPFYQIYEGAAIASNAQSMLMSLLKGNNFLPDIEIVKNMCKKNQKPHIVILNSPNNPTASVMNLEYLSEWVAIALTYDFILINDECYNQIYFDKAPPSILNACKNIGNDSFKNCLALNSVSKRSNAPGLRSGFIAGDANILASYLKYRTYMGVAQPLPLQRASTLAWLDEKHAQQARDSYAKNFALSFDILELNTPKASFYHWLEVDNGEEFAKNLWQTQGVQVLPGAYLSRGKVGKEYVRLALVYNEALTKEALDRIKTLKQKGLY